MRDISHRVSLFCSDQQKGGNLQTMGKQLMFSPLRTPLPQTPVTPPHAKEAMVPPGRSPISGGELRSERWRAATWVWGFYPGKSGYP